ncbi:MAG: tetratricopeptide repeat protein [Phycisphaerales bacterium]|nr:tetratricopeptide repeat protein [Phycisphaerales bacterium]
MKLNCMMALLICGATLTACNGPSSRGKQVREEAYSRMDAVNARLVHEQAVSAFETGQLERARSLMAEAIERFPKEPAWYLLMGRILLEQHRLDAAKRTLEYALELSPESSECAYYLGVVHERWSDDEEAAEYYRTAVELRSDRPQYVLACAETLIGSGQVDEARDLVESKMDHFEHHAGLRHLLSHVEMLSGDHQAAAEHCEAARLLAPDDDGIAHDLCQMQFAAGDWSECLSSIADMRTQSGEVPPVLERLRVRCLMATGRSVEARSGLRALCQENPTNGELWREYGMLSWDVADWKSVTDSGMRLQGLATSQYESALFLALGKRSVGDWQGASDDLEKLVAIFPDRPEAWAVLVGVRMRRGDLAGSEKARDLAVKWSPDTADSTAVSGVFGTYGP